MSIIGQLPVSDQYYPAESFLSLERALGWLQGKKDSSPNGFWNLLTDMKNRTEFQAPYQSNKPEPMIFCGRLEYREPVWKLVYEAASTYAPLPAVSQGKCADWLQELFMDARRYQEIQALVCEFENVIKEKKFEGVQLTVDPERSGAEEKSLLEMILKDLLPRMAEYIKKSSK